MTESAEPPDPVGFTDLKRARRRRAQFGLRALIVLVACCGVALWEWRVLWNTQDPVAAETRAVQNRALLALHSDHPADRVAASRELAELPYADNAITIAPLIDLLGDTNPEVRAAAGTALGSVTIKVVSSGPDVGTLSKVMMALVPLLRDRDRAVRLEAAIALGTLAAGPTAALLADLKKAVDGLSEAIGDPDATVRGHAIRTLGLTARGAAVSPPASLLAALEDPSPDNQTAAATALSSFTRGLDHCLPHLLKGLEEAPEPLRSVYCQALSGIRPNSSDPPVKQPGKFTAASVPALTTALSSHDRQVRSRAARLLGGLGGDAGTAVPALLAVLKEPLPPDPSQDDPAVEAALALPWIARDSKDADAAVAALFAFFLDSTASRRDAGAAGLTRFGAAARSAIPGLLAAFRDETTASDRPWLHPFAAMSVLAEIAPDSNAAGEVVAALTGLLRSGDASVVAATAQALGHFGRDAALSIPDLIEALAKSRGSKVDAHTIDANLKIIQALGSLAPGTTSEDDAVAALALALETKSPWTRLFALRALPKFGASASGLIPKLRALCSDTDPAIKAEAGVVLNRLEHDR
jgi:HEAT repeat protein